MIGLRFFSVYGPFGRPDMAYYAFSKAIKNKEIIVSGLTVGIIGYAVGNYLGVLVAEFLKAL